ncbi:hypothetical protein EI94DRAFT_1719883 [Lactarius quietus]|nr:hypothetical protein EI94DRAFT_1719883 [Lactarius quietus]
MAWLPALRVVRTVSLFAAIVLSLSVDLIVLTEAVETGFIINFRPLPVLWVLWLSSGSYAAWTDNRIEAFFPAESSCSYGPSVNDNDVLNQGCSEIKSITAFSFLTWIILMAYTSILLVLGIRAQGRGNSVWTASVRNQAMFCPDAKSGGTPAQMHTMLTSVPQTYPPAPPPASVPVPTPGAVQV